MISIIVPIYNQEPYISKCIDSILQQTYQDYELILINDGSTDRSKQICLNYAEKMDHIFYYEQENLGVSVARNLGIKHSNGEWIMFVDPDDYLKPNLLQRLYDNVDIKTDIVACCCEVFYNDQNFFNYFWDKTKKFHTEDQKKELIKQLFDGSYGQPQKNYIDIGVPWGKLYHRNMLVEHGLEFNPKLKRMQDNVFNMHAFWVANQIIYLNEPLYCYRLDNLFSYKNAKYRPFIYDNYLTIQQERIQFMQQHNLWKDKEIVDFFYINTLVQIIIMFNSYILHPSNLDSRKVMRRRVFEILHSEEGYYNQTIKELKFSTLTIKKHRIILLLFKSNSFLLIYWFWKIKNALKHNDKRM